MRHRSPLENAIAHIAMAPYYSQQEIDHVLNTQDVECEVLDSRYDEEREQEDCVTCRCCGARITDVEHDDNDGLCATC